MYVAKYLKTPYCSIQKGQILETRSSKTSKGAITRGYELCGPVSAFLLLRIDFNLLFTYLLLFFRATAHA